MTPRILLPMVLAVLLAGCAATDPPANGKGDANPTTTASDDSATPGADADALPDPGAAPHVHDLWEGRERITLLEEDFTVEPPEAAMWGFFTTYFFAQPSVGGFFVDLPEGAFVPEGTGLLEIQATWTDPTVTGLRFLYRHAGSGDISGWVPAPKGEVVALEVTPQMADMPHAQRTRWGFLFAADGTPPLLVGQVHLRIEAVKTRDPTLYPGHPDFWGDKTELLRLDADGETRSRIDPPFLPMPANNLAPPEDALSLTAPVPMETAWLVVRVDVLSVEPSSLQVANLRLEARTADDLQFDFDDVEVEPEVDGTSWTWRIPVEMQETDSPYADGSAWAILVVPEYASPVPVDCGCQESTLRYHATATAVKAPPMVS